MSPARKKRTARRCATGAEPALCVNHFQKLDRKLTHIDRTLDNLVAIFDTLTEHSNRLLKLEADVDKLKMKAGIT